MPENSAFEQRLAAELEQLAGPRRAVDAQSIRRRAVDTHTVRPWAALTQRVRLVTSTTPSGPGATWFSVVKLAAAASVVALFGGFLLAGGLTTSPGDDAMPAAASASPAPLTTDDLLDGATTEALRPGVLRVLDDGAGHAVAGTAADNDPGIESLYVDRHGRVWVTGLQSRTEGDRDSLGRALWLFGVPGRHEVSPDGFPGVGTFATAPDGTLWVAGWTHLASYDGETWTVQQPDDGEKSEDGCPHSVGVDVLSDGTIWATWCDRSGRLGPDGWEYFDGESASGGEPFIKDVLAMPDGTTLATDARDGRLVAVDGVAWSEVSLMDGLATRVTGTRVGADGSIWAHFISRPSTGTRGPGFEDWWAGSETPQDHLARFDGEAWTVYSADDGVPVLSHPLEWEGPEWGVGQDGSVWVLADPQPADYRGTDPDDLNWTLASFDGSTWTGYEGRFGWLDVGPDGTVWLGKSDARTSGDYAERLYLTSFDGTTWRDYGELGRPSLWGGFDIAPDGTAWVVTDTGLYAVHSGALAVLQ